MSRPKVFVTRRIPDAGLTKVLEHCDAEVWEDELPPPVNVLHEKVRGCQGILSLLTDPIDGRLMDLAPDLKVVSNFAVGYNNVDIAAATSRGIRVGNTPDVLTDATADTAFALMIGAARRLVECDQFARSGEWKTWGPMAHIGLDLVGKTIGIVGIGRIGYAMAERCYGGWKMKVLYSGRSVNAEAERDLKATKVDFDTLLAESDFVSVHCALTPETRGIFDATAFAKMKNTAIFVNTARGPIHNQADLVQALQKGDIYAAGLDVTDPEPPDPADPLLKLPNLTIAPHIGSATVKTRNAMAEIAADNLLLGLAGKPLRCCVNP